VHPPDQARRVAGLDRRCRPAGPARPTKGGQGSLLVASRELCGSRPDAKDPINAQWWQPLLQDLASGKTIDPVRPPQPRCRENTVNKGGLRLRYTDYLEPTADAIFKEYARCRPAMERILGVPLGAGHAYQHDPAAHRRRGFSSGGRSGWACAILSLLQPSCSSSCGS